MRNAADVRSLLASSDASFESLTLACTAEYDTAVLQRARQRSIPDWAQLVASGAIARIEPPAGDAGASANGDPRFAHDWRVWWRRPDCWRDEIVWKNGQLAISLACGPVLTTYVSASRTVYTKRPPARPAVVRSAREATYPWNVVERIAQMPLLGASRLAEWAIAALDAGTHAGRAAIRATATRVEGALPFGLWDFVRQYDLLVDAERGVLLRSAAIIDGEEAAVFSVREIAFDAVIPSAAFSLEPPSGTRRAKW